MAKVMKAQGPTAAQVLAAYYAAAVERSIELPAQQWQAGETLVFRLPKAGIPRYARVRFNGTFSRTDGSTVGTVTASPKYPYNVFSNVQLQDYSGIERINAAAYSLYLLSLVKRFGWDPGVTPENESYSAQVFSASIPAGTASSTTTAPLIFDFDVPISLSRNSIRGSFVAAVPEGESTLTLTCNAASGTTIDQPVTTGGGTTVSITGTVGVTVYFYDVPTNVQIPASEVSVVHELIEVKTSDNLEAGQEKRYTFPTGRTFYRIIQQLVLNGNMDTQDVTFLRFLVDESTPTLQEYLQSYLSRIREQYGRDLPTGVFVWDFMNKPWTPGNYGALQVGLTLSNTATTSGYSYLASLRECLYVAQAQVNLQQAGSNA